MCGCTISKSIVHRYVYDDVEWLPYRASKADPLKSPSDGGFAFSSQITNLAGTVRSILRMKPSTLEAMRNRACDVRDTHFTYGGVMNQINLFFNDPDKSDLVCNQLPTTECGCCGRLRREHEHLFF